MICCLLALFRIREIGKLTHKDIIERFEKEYVKKGIFSNELLSAIHHAYELTHECDCEQIFFIVNCRQIRGMLKRLYCDTLI